MQKNTASGGHCQIKILFEFIVLIPGIKKGLPDGSPSMGKAGFGELVGAADEGDYHQYQ
jgi:hypothetical protein